MRICVTATGNSLDAMAESSFGRAPWLLIIETDDPVNVEAIENRGGRANQGAGIAAAQVIADKGVQALLTGRVGPKAQAALQAAGIRIVENISRGTVREVLGQFKKGENQEVAGRISGKSTGCGQAQGRGMGRGGGGQGRGLGQGRRGDM